MNIKWNAENYRDNFSFVYEYGEELTGMFTLGRGSRIADAAKFSLEKPADGIFSNAVFHWIDDLSALAKNLAANLRASGELVCEFGGKGCA